MTNPHKKSTAIASRIRQSRISRRHQFRRLFVETLEHRWLLTGTFDLGEVAGTVTANAITEASGIAASLHNADVLWTHNDSGDSNRIHALNTSGNYLGAFTLSGASAVDYEDIAVGRGPTEGVSYIYAGDIGDNNAGRSSITVYRFAEPIVDATGGDQSTTLSSVDTLTFSYPDGARDAETLLVDPLNGDLYVVTKRDLANRVYRAPAPGIGDQTTTLEYMGNMTWGDTIGQGLTGAVGGDVSQSGLEVIFKSYTTVYVYDRDFDEELWEAITVAPTSNPPYAIEPQGEAIGFDADGQGYFTLSENTSQPLLYYARSGLPQAADYAFQDGVSPDATYNLARDVELREAAPDSSLGTNTTINVDGDDPLNTGHDNHALLRWDTSNIVPSSSVLAASITLNVTGPTSNVYDVFEVLRDWNEATATWNQADTGEPWSTAGAAGSGDRGSDVLGSLSGVGAVNIRLNAAGIAVVQNWIDNPASNYGLLFADSVSTDGIDFDSREATTVNTRPQLKITIDTTPGQTTTTPEFEVNHPPYLQLGDAPLVGYGDSATDQVELLWQTIDVGDGTDDEFVVQYRQLGDTIWQTVERMPSQITGVAGRVMHSAELNGLAYDTGYEYRVRHLRGGNILTTYQAPFDTRLAAGDAQPFTFVAYGDSADGNALSPFRTVQDRINQVDPDFALLLGDNVYEEGSHGESDARFDPDLNPEAVTWNSSHIDYVAYGNHDIQTANGQPSAENFAVPIPLADATAPAAPHNSEIAERNYAFDYGNVHFATFDTNSLNDTTRLDQQLDYLEADLAASAAQWKIVFGHHPVAGVPDKSEHPGENYYQQVVPRLRAAGVDLFLVGHSHTYSWTYPLLGESGGTATYVDDGDKNYAKGDGLVQLVAGTGGRFLRPGDYTQFPFVASGYTTASSTPVEHGFAHVAVTPSQLTVSYIAADNGAVIDQFSIVDATVGTSSITGTVWNDIDGDGTYDESETPHDGWTVFLDEDGDQTLDQGETSTTTAVDGSYEFLGLEAGTFFVEQVLPEGYEQTSPNVTVQSIVDQVAVDEYEAFHQSIENMGLGLYGGGDYNQGIRDRDGTSGAGSLGNQETRLYLQEQFTAMGLNVSLQGPYLNVVAELTGSKTPENIFLVGAHYDTTSGGDRPGGDDNASGTAGILEAARVLSQYEFESTIRFVGFNAEEDGLLGSKNYVNNQVVANNENIVGMISLDMILRPGFDANPNATIDVDVSTRTNHPASVNWANAFRQAATLYVPELTVDATTANLSGGSDQDPFVAAGFPAILASENTAQEIWGGSNAYYHTAQDGSDRLANDPNNPSGVTYDYAFATDVTQAAVGLIAQQAEIIQAGHLVTLDDNQAATGNDFGTIYNTATLPYSEDFNDGVADFFEPQAGTWTVSNDRYAVTPVKGANGVSTLNLESALPTHFQVDAVFNATPGQNGFYTNGFIVFDYQSPTNFKYAGALVGSNQWLIGQWTASGRSAEVKLNETINANTDYALTLVVDGTQVELLANGVSKLSRTFTNTLNDGDIGLRTQNAITRFDNFTVQAVSSITAEIVAVTPDPRNTGVGSVEVQFSADVTGVDIGDFQLTRDNQAISLTGLSIAQVTPTRYTLDLSTVTTLEGSYQLKLVASGSGIEDAGATHSLRMQLMRGPSTKRIPPQTSSMSHPTHVAPPSMQ